jgi:diacylglycerol kinase family enzyme
MDDGLLDLALFSGGDLGRKLALAARAVRGQLERDASNGAAGLDYLRGSTIRIETERPMPVQADGEYVGETPLELGVARQSLNVLVAPHPSALLGEV